MKLFITFIALFIFATLAPVWLINLMAPLTIASIIYFVVMTVKSSKK